MRALTVLAMVAIVLTAALPAWAQTGDPVEANGLVILLTDYGTDSIYVGMIKGAIYSAHLEAKVDSLTNSVPPFDITTGAYMLVEGCGSYPAGTTFCCVVDPGVGTARKCIVLETKSGHRFVGPDNGLLSLVAKRYGVADLRECTNPDLFYRKGESTTFHGRDIFGPVAAALAGGAAMDAVGPTLGALVTLNVTPSEVKEGAAHGVVIRSDPYGNLVTNIHADQLGQLGIVHGDRLAVRIGDVEYDAPFARTYGSVAAGKRLVLVQSSGFVECAINMGSLAEATGEGVHAKVVIKKANDDPGKELEGS